MSKRRVSVQEIAGGPLLVRGADEVVSADGSVGEATRSVVAVCRCGRSDRMPWCDASHRARRRKQKKNDEG